jgi:hypothetical protein
VVVISKRPYHDRPPGRKPFPYVGTTCACSQQTDPRGLGPGVGRGEGNAVRGEEVPGGEEQVPGFLPREHVDRRRRAGGVVDGAEGPEFGLEARDLVAELTALAPLGVEFGLEARNSLINR